MSVGLFDGFCIRIHKVHHHVYRVFPNRRNCCFGTVGVQFLISGVVAQGRRGPVSSWVLSFLFRPIIGRGKRGKEREKEGEEARGN